MDEIINNIDWNILKNGFYATLIIFGSINILLASINVLWKASKSLATVTILIALYVAAYYSLKHGFGDDVFTNILSNMDLSILEEK